MTYEMVTHLQGSEVLERAKRFFAECIPHNSAFVETEGPSFATFRGQGGEELTLAVFESPNGGTRIRASTLFFDQAIGRFFSTLPAAEVNSP